jgi:hypothetical protein
MTQIIARFLVGGVVASSFAIVGDILGPKSFAGLFGPQPFTEISSGLSRRII